MLRTQTLTIDEDAHADPLEGGVEFVHGMLVQHEGEKTEAKAVAQVPPGMLRTQTLTIDEDAHADPLEGGVEFVHGMLVQHEGEKTEAKAVAQISGGTEVAAARNDVVGEELRSVITNTLDVHQLFHEADGYSSLASSGLCTPPSDPQTHEIGEDAPGGSDEQMHESAVVAETIAQVLREGVQEQDVVFSTQEWRDIAEAVAEIVRSSVARHRSGSSESSDCWSTGTPAVSVQDARQLTPILEDEPKPVSPVVDSAAQEILAVCAESVQDVLMLAQEFDSLSEACFTSAQSSPRPVDYDSPDILNFGTLAPEMVTPPSDQNDEVQLTADLQTLPSDSRSAAQGALVGDIRALSQHDQSTAISAGSADVGVGATIEWVSEACQTEGVTRDDSSVQTEVQQQHNVSPDASTAAREMQSMTPLRPATMGSPMPPEVQVRGPAAALPTMAEFSRLHSPAVAPMAARSSPTLPALQRASSRPEQTTEKVDKSSKKRYVATGRVQTDLRMGDLESWHRHVEDIRMQAEHRSLQHEARFAKAKLAVEQRDKRIKQLTGQLREFPGQMRRALDGLFRQRCLQVHEGDEDMRAQVLAMWSEVDGLLGAVRWKKTAI